MRHKREQPKAAKTGIAKQPCVWVVEYLNVYGKWRKSIDFPRAYESRKFAKNQIGDREDYRIRKYVRSES